MKNMKKKHNVSKKGKFKPGSKKRENKCIVSFDDKEREAYLTGFHRRKVERRKAAVAELKKKIKEEKTRVREERHKEYVKMLKERNEVLEATEDDLDELITSTTESVQYDHPNHTVTVTTISDLDLTAAHRLGLPAQQDNGEAEDEKKEVEKEEKEKKTSMPRKAGNPIMNKKIRSLTASLSAYTSKRNRKGKQEGQGGRGRQDRTAESKNRAGKKGKWQRRRQTGKRTHHQD